MSCPLRGSNPDGKDVSHYNGLERGDDQPEVCTQDGRGVLGRAAAGSRPLIMILEVVLLSNIAAVVLLFECGMALN